MQFSNKILNDLYPQVFRLRAGPGQMNVPTTKCCKGMIMAKQNNGKIQYFYCEKCNNEISSEELKEHGIC